MGKTFKRSVSNLLKLFQEASKYSLVERIAANLWSNGWTFENSHDILSKNPPKQIRDIPQPLVIQVQNSLRDIERLGTDPLLEELASRL